MARSWTVGRKIALGFGLALVMLFVVGAVGYRSTDALVENDRQVTHTHLVLEELARVLSLMKDAETGQRGFLLTGNEAYLEPYQAGLAGIDASLERVRGLTADNPRQQRRLDAGALLVKTKLSELARTVDLRRTAGFEPALEVVTTGRGKKAMDDLRGVLAAMDQEERDLLAQRTEQAERSAGGAKTTILVAALLALASVSAAGWLITRSLSRELSTAISNLRSCSTELETAAKQQASGSREQASAASEVSTTLHELLATSRQIAESARRVAGVAAEAAEAARGGEQTGERTHAVIAGIKGQVELIVAHMLDLGRKSQQAGGILELVNELSDQTNILAINATIEAAGAGEHGKRFGVVADEIRKLADRVGLSTKEIKALVEDIRAAVNTTVMATESGTKAVDAGAQQFAEVGASFKAIAGVVATTTEAAQEIELSTKQQATAVEQVNVAIASVAQAVREMEASSTQTLQAATQLTGLSRDISRLIEPSAAA